MMDWLRRTLGWELDGEFEKKAARQEQHQVRQFDSWRSTLDEVERVQDIIERHPTRHRST